MFSAIRAHAGSRYSQSPRHAHAQRKKYWAAAAGGVVLLLLLLNWSRSTLSTGAWYGRLQPDKHGMLRNLVYFNRPDVVDRLGCPTTTDEVPLEKQFTCLYQFRSSGAVLKKDLLASNLSNQAQQYCSAIYQPLPADWGRSWCIRVGRQPSWLQQELPQPWPTLDGPTLLTGQLLGPNPTHQLNLHWYHIHRWMQQARIPFGTLRMIFDGTEEKLTLGTYGRGLAAAFGQNLGLLQNLPDVTKLSLVKLSVGGGFQFDMNLFQSDSPILCDYLRMGAAVKRHYKIDPRQEANANRVVIATRKDTESRRLVNAAELATQLNKQGWNASVVTMGNMTFEEQLHIVTDAKVLVGVSGSDLVSLVFMPFRAVVVEIFPLVLGTPVFCPELGNLARNSGKVHKPYYSPYNATLFEDPETGQPIQARPIHQSKLVTVHVPGLVSHIQGAVQAADAIMFYGFHMDMDIKGRITKCEYDHPAPQGLLYGCSGPDC